MKKLAALLISLAMILAMAVTGCSSSGSGQTASPQPSQPAGSQTPAASGDYPKSSIQVVVPFSAGGGTDLFARIVVDKMSQIVGVPIEVVNVPGGSATIGTTQVANANTDGYTIGFSISTPLCVTPLLGETSYTLEDMQPICNAYTVLHGIYVAADSPIQDVDDLIAFINEKGGTLSYAGSGTGNMQHMCLEEWASQADPEGTWNLTNVPYDGDPEEIVALMSGELPFATLQVHGAKSAVEAGNVRCIMIFGDTTPQWMTDGGYFGPNSVELGYECRVKGLVGFYGPAGMSADAVKVLSDAFHQAVQDEGVLESIANIGLGPDYRDTEAYTAGLEELVPVADELLHQLGFIAG